MNFPSLKIIRNALLCFLLLSFFSIGVKLKSESDFKLAVVLAERVEIKSGRSGARESRKQDAEPARDSRKKESA